MRDVELPIWLKELPLAPEFRPTDTEFADPIAYISKIEKEASAFGICKIIPPLPKPSKKYVISNLNKSLLKCPDLGSHVNLLDVGSSSNLDSGDKGNVAGFRGVFTTRHQELGMSAKKNRGSVQSQPSAAHMQVWQSGGIYTLEQFESKSKAFARSLLGMIKEVSPLVVETMFWKAASEKPIYVEYANDVPGSGFGEPDGPFRYFNRRRRKRTFRRNSRSLAYCKKRKLDTTGNSLSDENNNAVMENKPNTSLQPSPESTSSLAEISESSRFSLQKHSDSSNEVEGTAGWKLSNSPWNLQIISRSPGSLTRFMPDDIPGVTSPMVYIGMLFSWFAWHVEDHELHSLNFLHTGSPKTWYAVPGECAFAFEEVIRTQVYGGGIDRLAALTLLGEKTTLLSPEVVVASGLPCCRLVQNPGEFVVTFPRAYHVGFSHGFNCGEAANFGTPQWLKVAKEAAVRRAAMNYLPMLSHQQLLYLLTMSFVSRVPRSLLPGARSSRLRDRQKEERELLVKRAFIEDMLNENKLVSVLLGKQSPYRAVLWDPESLPSSKESQLSSDIANVASIPRESDCLNSENDCSQHNLFDQMSLYMETMNDLYADDDDLSCDFQVDSGTLACVACGILGFPFMSIVQPSEKASVELLHARHSLVKDKPKVSVIEKFHPPDLDGHVTENLSPVPPLPSDNLSVLSMTKFDKRWNTSIGFLRPRIFCLEHAAQIEDLVQSKGGVNMLVICHSDYQKIKAHSAAVAEQIGSCFDYKDFPLDSASEEDLNLINLAIDDEEHNECGEDWTSELGINLRYCVKFRNNSPSKQPRHTLILDGLLSEATPMSNFVNFTWHSRRSRSKHKSKHSVHNKQCENIQLKKGEASGGKLEPNVVRKEDKLIQYSRRNFKFKPQASVGANQAGENPKSHLTKEITSASCGIRNNFCRSTFKSDTCNVENNACDSEGMVCFAPGGNSEMQHDIQVLRATPEVSRNSSPASVVNVCAAATSVVENDRAQVGDQTFEENNMKSKACNLAKCESSQVQHQINDTKESAEKSEKASAEEASSLVDPLPTVQRFELWRENQIREGVNMTDEACDLVALDDSVVQCELDAHTDGDVLINEVSDLANSHMAVMVAGSFDVSMENADAERSCLDGNVCDFLDPEIQGTNVRNVEESVSSNVVPINQTTPEDSVKVSKENCTAEEMRCGGEVCSLQDSGVPERFDLSTSGHVLTTRKERRKKIDAELQIDDKLDNNGFARSPCEGLRPRVKIRNDIARISRIDTSSMVEDKPAAKKVRKSSDGAVSGKKKVDTESCHRCNLEGCRMSFKTKAELVKHRRNRCTYEGCGKRFSSHKYAMLHQRVHDDERPLKCPWKGCTMSFKWAWARTEHLRVHTGVRPYRCAVEGCGLTFRFVSDFSRHRRKTGHYVNLPS